MPDLWMNVDEALAEVPVNVMPLIDSGDFVTVEDAVAYDAGGMDLRWNFVTTAGAYTSTAVTPTTGGAYDWAHQGDGMYSIEIPASGGASINNDTEGFGWFTGRITGVLPFRGPVIGFRAAALNDALIDGGDNLDVNVAQWLGTAAATPTVAGVPEVDVTHWLGTVAQGASGRPQVDVELIEGADPSDTIRDAVVDDATRIDASALNTATGTTIPAILDDTDLIDDATSGLAKIATDVAAILVDTGTTLQGELDGIQADTEDIQSRLGTPSNLGSGATVAANLADIEAQTDDIGSAGAGLTALATAAELAKVPKSDSTVTWNATALASIQQEATDALNAYDPPTNAEMEARTIAAATYATAANLATVAGYLDTEIAAILEDTGTTLPAQISALNNLSAAQVNAEADTALADVGLTTTVTGRIDRAISAIFTTAMTEAYSADGAAPTPAQALFLILQRLTEFTIAGTTITVKKLDGSTTAFTLTLDDATTPTSSTRAT